MISELCNSGGIGASFNPGQEFDAIPQVVRTFWLFLVLGFAGFVIGCGPGAQDSSSEAAPDAKTRLELQRKAQQEARKGIGTGKASAGRKARPGGR